ncbi:UNVERIFIED_CONTAM: AT-rich interactive domain-containing protein 5 [Sesamum angustifolium]|uniref:AT-rich interactive domain-containing protein 5 n=1 Tax=Sesamum angustifolium TaxID=2727405 RepID=A0AAW2J3R0_9LAMI
MSKSDVEMEDAEKLSQDSGNNIQESESKVTDAEVENEGEKLHCAAAVTGDENKRESGGEDTNKSRNEDKYETDSKTEVKDKTDAESEANDPMIAEGSVCEQINSKSENEELTNTRTEDKEQTAARSAVEEQTDAKNEVVEQNATNVGMKEEKSTENGIEGEDNVKKVEEKPNEHVAEEEPKEIGKDADYVRHDLGVQKTMENTDGVNDSRENRQLQTELSANDDGKTMENTDTVNDPGHNLLMNGKPMENAELDEVVQGEDEEMEDAGTLEEDKMVKDDPKEMCEETDHASREADGNGETVETAAKTDGELANQHEAAVKTGSELANQHEASVKTDGELANQHETAAKTDGELANQHEAATPQSLVRYSPTKAGDHSGETVKSVFTQATLPLTGEDDDGTPEDQAAFMKELESFYRQKAMDFKPPKFYGQPLNCLKLWRAVIRLGGYDRVTGSKLWRQVGESFHPPKTCTTVSWTFRIFYEKSLLEFERHKTQSGELQLPVATLPEASGVEANCYQGSGSGRARRDAAARAMQGWHAQRLFGNGEVGEPIVKDKNLNTAKREKNLKSIGSLKQKRPNEVDHSNKAARTETSKQLVASVVDVGPPADWVKINVRQTVRVQSDPAGRVVITGQPEQVDNPWGITAFKKVVNLPARIDPLQTSAVVSLHGRLFVRVPLEQSNI